MIAKGLLTLLLAIMIAGCSESYKFQENVAFDQADDRDLPAIDNGFEANDCAEECAIDAQSSGGA